MPPGDGNLEKRDFSEDAASPDPSSSDQKKRRRINVGSTSSRGVANLTPDQLAKKRANDREAQRAIRERTKNQIENLERRIRELTSQQPYQELQQVQRQKESVEAENAEIKKRLATILSLIEPILGQHGLQASLYAAPPPSQPPYVPIPNSNQPTPSSNSNASTTNDLSLSSSLGAQGAFSPWQAANAPMGPGIRHCTPIQDRSAQQLAQPKHDMIHNLDIGPEKLALEFLLDRSQRVNKISNGTNGSHETSTNLQLPTEDLDRDSAGHGRSISTARYNPPNANSEMTGHAAPVRNGPPTCPLDSLLLDFLHERQQQAADGVATSKLVGPAYPSVSSLLNPARSLHSHPLSKVFTDILATFPDIATLPEKVAVLYIMFIIMRWQISPTQENYDRLPDWVTPRASQLFTPHPAWIDHVPWPKMRDRLVRDYNPRDYLFDNWFIPFTSTLSVNWPYEPTDTLLSSPASDDLTINPVFERHLRTLENWSLGTAFANAFPGMVDTYRLKKDEERRA